MKCTSCREVIRPVVAIDIDGTLADYHHSLANFAWAYFDRRPMGAEWRGDGEFEDYLGLTKAEYREAKMAYRQGGMKRIQPIMLDAQYLMQTLRQSGAEIWITTTRPWKRLDNIDPDTQHWLAKHDIPYEHLLYDDDKYGVLAERVGRERVAFVLEDLPDMYCRARDLFGLRAVMIAREHNRWWRQEWGARAVVSPSLHHAGITALRCLDTWQARYDMEDIK